MKLSVAIFVACLAYVQATPPAHCPAWDEDSGDWTLDVDATAGNDIEDWNATECNTQAGVEVCVCGSGRVTVGHPYATYPVNTTDPNRVSFDFRDFLERTRTDGNDHDDSLYDHLVALRGRDWLRNGGFNVNAWGSCMFNTSGLHCPADYALISLADQQHAGSEPNADIAIRIIQFTDDCDYDVWGEGDVAISDGDVKFEVHVADWAYCQKDATAGTFADCDALHDGLDHSDSSDHGDGGKGGTADHHNFGNTYLEWEVNVDNWRVNDCNWDGCDQSDKRDHSDGHRDGKGGDVCDDHDAVKHGKGFKRPGGDGKDHHDGKHDDGKHHDGKDGHDGKDHADRREVVTGWYDWEGCTTGGSPDDNCYVWGLGVEAILPPRVLVEEADDGADWQVIHDGYPVAAGGSYYFASGNTTVTADHADTTYRGLLHFDAIDGGWSEWGPCSAACDTGTQTQTCTAPIARFGGAACPGGDDDYTKTQDCNTEACSGGVSASAINGMLTSYNPDIPKSSIVIVVTFQNRTLDGVNSWTEEDTSSFIAGMIWATQMPATAFGPITVTSGSVVVSTYIKPEWAATLTEASAALMAEKLKSSSLFYGSSLEDAEYTRGTATQNVETPPEEESANEVLIAILCAAVLLLGAAVGFLIWKKRQNSSGASAKTTSTSEMSSKAANTSSDQVNTLEV